MQNFNAKTYIPHNFHLLKKADLVPVHHREKNEWIGEAVITDNIDEEYLLEFRLTEPVEEDLYATITQEKSNGIVSRPAYVSLSKDQIYGRFTQTIGQQQE
ncbi:hypothetical protein [Pedobacter sp. R-06]|uniref:hypothetical protein n=1 Tax=Pedobacter sp. R-06 TaxID=3404051 RepID=UPI003CEB60FE